MGKVDEKKLYVGREGGWGLVLGIVIILGYSGIWREKGRGGKEV